MTGQDTQIVNGLSLQELSTYEIEEGRGWSRRIGQEDGTRPVVVGKMIDSYIGMGQI